MVLKMAVEIPLRGNGEVSVDKVVFKAVVKHNIDLKASKT